MADKVICTKCNTPNQSDDVFCLECGRPLRGESTLQLEPLEIFSGAGTQPLAKNTSFLPRPEKAIFGDRFLGNNLVHSDNLQHGYLVKELVESDAPRITKCSNPECGAVHVPLNGEPENYCTTCSAPLTDSKLVMVLFEARSLIFGDSAKLADIGLSYGGLRAPAAYFKEVVAGEERFCLVIPYVQPLPAGVDRDEVYKWGPHLAETVDYLHQNGVTFNGGISKDTFSIENGKMVISNFHKSQIVEEVNDDMRAADIQALAGVLYQWLTGRAQFRPESGNPSIVNKFFETAVQKPGFKDASEFAKAFEEFAREATTYHPVDHHMGRYTDVGVLRTLNEDSLLTLQLDRFLESAPAPMGVYVVADGMGGHSAGEVASGLIVNKIAELARLDSLATVSRTGDLDHCQWILMAMQEANKAVYDMAQSMGSDMGSTCVMAVADGNRVCIGHVGDSRAYCVNSLGIEPLTTDHSLVERLVDSGQITRKEARHHPQRNVIYRTMGDKPKVDVETSKYNLIPGDRLLLCSDGLNGMIEDEVIRKIVMEESTSPQEACEKLIEAAKDAGGDDNITVVILEMV